MKPADVIGLDLSYSETGLSWAGGTRVVKTLPAHGCDVMRARRIWEEVMPCLEDSVVVWMEDVPPVGHAIHRLGVLQGIVRDRLMSLRVPVVRVAPGSLKKYATGAGNASKTAVVGECIRRLGYQGTNHNESDAIWLREMGLAAHGLPHTKVPKTNADALKAPGLREFLAEVWGGKEETL